MHTTDTNPAAFQLLDQWDGHLKFNGRAPRTLEQVAIAHAEYVHRCRLAEIKAIAAKLALLEPFLPTLHARGIKLARRDFTTMDHGKTLRIQPPICERDDKLCAALLELGFRETARRDWGRDEHVTLKHGRSLVVAVDVTKAAVPLATQSQAVTP